MSKKLYEESSISGIASAIREKLGVTNTYKVSEMRNAILSIETGGSGLPEGMATGTFQCTPANMMNEVSIEHGLGAVPRFVFVFTTADSSSPNAQEITFAATYNGSSSSHSFILVYNAPTMTDVTSKTADTSTNIYLPTNGNEWYFITNIYRWIAIL